MKIGAFTLFFMLFTLYCNAQKGTVFQFKEWQKRNEKLMPYNWHLVPGVGIGRTPETGYEFKAGALYRFYSDSLQKTQKTVSYIYSYFTYTEFKQKLVETGWNFFTPTRRLYFKGNAEYQDYFDRIYTIGPKPNKSSEQYYYYDKYYLNSKVLYNAYDKLFAGVRLNWLALQNIEYKNPVNYDTTQLIGNTGGLTSDIGLNIIFENRDVQHIPSRGSYVEFILGHTAKFTGSEFNYRHFKLDARKYFPISKNRFNVIALQFITENVKGDAPFYAMPMLGGDKIVRGYFKGQYRDKTMIATQAEIRAKVYKQIGFTVFGSVGQVADSYSKLNLDYLKSGYGIGLRWYSDKLYKTAVRIDLSMNAEGKFLYYFKVNEAF